MAGIQADPATYTFRFIYTMPFTFFTDNGSFYRTYWDTVTTAVALGIDVSFWTCLYEIDEAM